MSRWNQRTLRIGDMRFVPGGMVAHPHFLVGLDIGSEHFSAALASLPWQLHESPQTFENHPEGFAALSTWLRQQGVRPTETVCVLEATGVYGEALCHYLVAQQFQVCVEPPQAVKRAFPVHGHKNDAADSQHLAEYGYRYADQLHRWQPQPERLEQLKVLLTMREQFVTQRTAQQNAYTALQRKAVRTPRAEALYRESIVYLATQLKALDAEIRRLFDEDPPLQELLLLLVSIPGVGLLLAAHVIVLTQCTPALCDATKLAAHWGISPYEHTSGKSVRGKPRSRRSGPSGPRKLLYLAALSVRQHQTDFAHYFHRKVAEGKAPRLVINNIENKLVRRICGVLRSRTPYLPNYRSVSPAAF